jgi:addiction module HigA family antidote
MRGLIAIHPGEILREEFLEPLGLSAYRLAKELHVPAPRINDILLGKRGITADTALRLGRYFNMTPQFWLNLQTEFDLRVASGQVELDAIAKRPAAPTPRDLTGVGK